MFVEAVTRCQVACLSLIGNYLYAGTTYGCLVVIDPSSASVVCLCQPYASDELSVILPLETPVTADTSDSAHADMVFIDDPVLHDEEEMADLPPRPSLLATVGRGYMDLVGSVCARYRTPEPSASPSSFEIDPRKTVIISWSGDDWPSPKTTDIAMN
jgi:hypothetical protein